MYNTCSYCTYTHSLQKVWLLLWENRNHIGMWCIVVEGEVIIATVCVFVLSCQCEWYEWRWWLGCEYSPTNVTNTLIPLFHYLLTTPHSCTFWRECTGIYLYQIYILHYVIEKGTVIHEWENFHVCSSIGRWKHNLIQIRYNTWRVSYAVYLTLYLWPM